MNLENKLKELGNKIKSIRKNKKMTQLDLSNKVGYKNRSIISKIEKGEVDLPLDKIKIIAEALGVSPQYLIGWDNNPIPKVIDPYYVDTSMLTEAQKTELNTIINMNVAMFNSSRELSEHDRKTIIKVLTEAFINTLPNKK